MLVVVEDEDVDEDVEVLGGALVVVVVVVLGGVVVVEDEVVVDVVVVGLITSTSKDFSAWLSCPSIAVQVTIVLPGLNMLPDGGVHSKWRTASSLLSALAV